ncbi:MAG: carboxypeptidase regulatory-like domain-containing protein [Planctomycetota bacterium]
MITLDGKPLPDATVRFNPKQQGGSPMVGPSSFGTTDSQGRYTLRTHKGRSGAVVGRHVVSVSTYATELVDPQNSDETRVLSEERVPKRYRTPSELTYEVPSGGTGDANFDLTTS